MVKMIHLTWLAASFTFATQSTYAQPNDRIAVAGEVLNGVMEVVGNFVLAVELCDAGEMDPWFMVIQSIDRRYEQCVRQDASWAGLASGWENEAREAEAQQMKGAGVGSFAYIRKMRELPGQIRSHGVEAFCASAPWKVALDRRGDNAVEREKFSRIHPTVDIDEYVKVANAFRQLGLNKAWWESPCDQFWPEGYSMKSR